MSVERILQEDIVFTMRPLNNKDLALLYHVSRKTIAKWLRPFDEQIGNKNGYFYTVAQVKKIFELLGPPACYQEYQKSKLPE